MLERVVVFLALCAFCAASGAAAAGLNPCGEPTVAQPGEVTSTNNNRRKRVVGGDHAVPGSGPWMAQISWILKGKPHVRCGGTLIAPGWVLTAAHCFYDDKWPRELAYWKYILTIGLGKVHLFSSEEVYQRSATVVDIIVHPDYEPRKPAEYDNDIALVRLDLDVEYTDYVMPICLPSGEFYQNHLSGGHGTVMGWGHTEHGGIYAERLMVVELPLQNDSTCHLDNGEYTDNMVCAGDPLGGRDSCQGDSGGPLIVHENGTWYQTGVVSFGKGCGRKDRYGYYTKLANYNPWIQRKIGNMAHGKPVNMSSTLDSNHDGLQATDGYTGPDHYCASTTSESAPWLAVDLQYETYVTSIALTGGLMAGIFMYFDARMRDFNVGVTNTINPMAYDLCYHHPGILDDGTNNIACDRVVRGQYVVIHMNSSTQIELLEVCELQVYFDRTAICLDLTIDDSNTTHYDTLGGKNVTVTCNDGYIVEGTSSSSYQVTCLQTGEWSTLHNCTRSLDTFRKELRAELTKMTDDILTDIKEKMETMSESIATGHDDFTLNLTMVYSELASGIQTILGTLGKIRISKCIEGHTLLAARGTEIQRITVRNDGPTLDITDHVLELGSVRGAIAIDYDPVDKYVYWTDHFTYTISRAHLDGSCEEALVSDVPSANGLAVDWQGRNLFWTDTMTDTIEGAGLDGTSRRVIVQGNMDQACGIVLDYESSHMYWTDVGQTPKIERANFDGSARTVLVASSLKRPIGLALDLTERKMYWSDYSLGVLEVANLDGTQRKVLVAVTEIWALSLLDDSIYWTLWSGSVERADKSTGLNRVSIRSYSTITYMYNIKPVRVI